MTTHDKDKIIAAAKESGFSEVKSRPSDADVRKGYRLSGEFKGWKASPKQLEAFYSIAFEHGRQAEREECAKVCENNYWSEEIDWWLAATKKDVSAKAARKCAAAIRARGDTK